MSDEFCGRWKRVPLRSLTSKIGSGATPRGGERAYKRSGTPLIRSMNVHCDGFRTDGLAYLGEKQATALNGVAVQAGDVLLNITGASIGRVTQAPEEMDGARVNQHVCIIRPIKGVEPSFVARYLASPAMQAFIAGENYGVTRQALTKEMIENISLPTPPLEEQRSIVAKVERLFERSKTARKELIRIPRLAERYKQAILAAAFRGLLTTEWRHENPDQLLLSPNIGSPQTTVRRRKGREGAQTLFKAPYSVPRSWQWTRLPALGDLDRGRSRHRPRNDPRLYGGPYPFIQTGDVKAARGCVTTFTQTYSDAGLAQSRLWPKGTVCITIAANIADTAILGIDACFPDSIVGFIPDEKICDPLFVEFFIRTVKADLSAFAPATAQKNINLETLSLVHVPCPPLEEQKQIVKSIEAAFTHIDQALGETTRAIDLLDRLDQAVLAKAFRGELIPPDQKSA